MNNLRKTLFAWISATLVTIQSLHAAVPEMLHYQGYVTVSGVAFTGAGQFKFALINRQGTTTLWSHDGTSVGCAAPNSTVSIPVSAGIYSVLLGDTTIVGMTQRVPVSVFETNSAVFLRVWFDDGVNGSQQLAPDTRIASVGFAMVAASLAGGSVTGDALAPALTLGGDNNVGTMTLKSSGDETRAVLDAGTAPGNASLKLYDATGAFDTVRLSGSYLGTGGGFASLKNKNGNATLQLFAQETDDPLSSSLLQLNRNDGKSTVALRSTFGGEDGGALQLGNSSANTTVELTGDAGENQGRLILKHSDLATRVRVDADGPNDSGEIKLFDTDGTETVKLLGANSLSKGGILHLSDADGTATVTLDADDANEGGRLELKRGDGTVTARLQANLGSDNGGLAMYDPNGGESIRFTGAFQGTGAGFLQFKNLAGAVTMSLNGDSNGEGRITTQVIEITGGSDLSETFNIAAHEGEPEPGMIVCIDPQRPGELRLSGTEYDSTVAGVIGGAGGVRPGMLMGQPGTLAHGKHPVALTGRVYCRVDASQGAIRPGDLITTSSTPGHGKKASPDRAAGCVVGKAMTGLDEGRGLVLVLVSLQ